MLLLHNILTRSYVLTGIMSDRFWSWCWNYSVMSPTTYPKDIFDLPRLPPAALAWGCGPSFLIPN